MKIDPTIFKAYDIRGIYPKQLNPTIAYRIGLAYSHLLKQENPGKKLNIIIANDMRLSSPQLKKSLIKGILDSGINITDIGLASTPTFYFAVGYYKHHGGIQISASHNPKDWNGFKVKRQFRGATYDIEVINPKRLDRARASLTADGQKIEGDILPLAKPGTTLGVKLIMGGGNGVR